MRRPRSAIGVSMLDLISNALAATLILFFVLSILKLPPIPPTRVIGTLVVRCSIHADINPTKADIEVWLRPPSGVDNPPLERKIGANIAEFNDDPRVFGLYGLHYEKVYEGIYGKNLPPEVMVYAPPDSHTNVRIVIVRDPNEGEGMAGLLYVDHQELTLKIQKAKARIEAWFIKDDGKFKLLVDSTRFIAPTQTFTISFIIRDLLKESP